MPEPLRGLVAVAEFGSKFDVDAAVARLEVAGIRATASYDPAMNSVATYFASDRTFEVLVRTADAARAQRLLGDDLADLPPEFTDDWEPASRMALARPRVRGCLIKAMVVLLAIIVAILVAFAVRR